MPRRAQRTPLSRGYFPIGNSPRSDLASRRVPIHVSRPPCIYDCPLCCAPLRGVLPYRQLTPLDPCQSASSYDVVSTCRMTPVPRSASTCSLHLPLCTCLRSPLSQGISGLQAGVLPPHIPMHVRSTQIPSTMLTCLRVRISIYAWPCVALRGTQWGRRLSGAGTSFPRLLRDAHLSTTQGLLMIFMSMVLTSWSSSCVSTWRLFMSSSVSECSLSSCCVSE